MSIEPTFRRENERIAARHNLPFYIEYGIITYPYRGEENREATKEERAIWAALVGSNGYLPANPQEFLNVLDTTEALNLTAITVNAIDLWMIRKHYAKKPSEQEIAVEPDEQGLKLALNPNLTVYSSILVPCGYYCPGKLCLTEAEVTPSLEKEIGAALKPFI